MAEPRQEGSMLERPVRRAKRTHKQTSPTSPKSASQGPQIPAGGAPGTATTTTSAAVATSASASSGRTNEKPLEGWTKEEVQEWLNNGDYKEYAPLVPLNGRQLARRTKEDFVAALGPMAGASLFDDVQDLKAPQQEQLGRPHTGMPPQQQPGTTILQPTDVQEIARLAARLAGLEINRRSSSMVAGQMTFAEYYDRAVMELGSEAAGQTTFWVNLPTPEKEAQVYSKDPPSPGADEAKYQDFFIKEMQRLEAKDFCKYQVKDTSHSRSLGGCKPGATFWPKQETLVGWNKAFLGEIKTLREEGQFTPADKGEAMTWAQRLLELNPQRQSATSFLTDTKHIMFFRIRRGPQGQLTYSWTKVVPLYKTITELTRSGRERQIRMAADGYNWLQALLATDPKDECVGLVDILQPRFSQDIALLDLLGGGATSQVYRADNGKVVKILTERFVALCKNEKCVLDRLSQNHTAIQEYIPKVIESTSNALLMEPEGAPLKAPTSTHWNQVLLVLKELHACGYVHRDIRPDNILVHPATQAALLIDFGFSVQAATLVPYCGTVHYASNSILDALLRGCRNIICEPADDLVSLVRSAFCLHFPAFRRRLEAVPHHDRQEIRRLWDEKLKSRPAWKQCLQAAEQARHDELAELLRQVVY